MERPAPDSPAVRHDLTDLDDAYSNAAHIPDGPGYPARWAARAAAFRAEHPPVELRYGDGARQVIDLFLPQGAPQGVMVFFHGGYWLAFGPRDWSHLAAGALAQGWAVAVPGYTLAPAARITGIVAEAAQATARVAAEVPGPVVLAGHSAGGHLVARLGCADMAAAMPGVGGRLRRIMPISPLADLRPLLRTSMNADLRLDAAEAAAQSPALCPAPEARVQIWVGADERPAFLDQARLLSEAWVAPLHLAPARHHFDVIDPLAEPDSRMVQILLG
ncbi:alpha/beta hydrolase [Halodurantibacterium flavum]|uniref:Alpha/beta hydrolase n=1 Tax=Halodurantibacterium flavum TaxID=1382802 RepID=A0ABW4S246_9RHOB